MKTKLIKIAIKYCSRRGMCKYGNQCKPKRCKYFKYIVLPSWLKDIKGRQKGHWRGCGEYKEYEKVIDFIY